MEIMVILGSNEENETKVKMFSNGKAIKTGKGI
jgi:hypothetical protein